MWFVCEDLRVISVVEGEGFKGQRAEVCSKHDVPS